jgi:Protein of unknown function with HXXEE motif
MSMIVPIEWLVWAPLIAASVHILEEFAWPGGFPSWYRHYRANPKSANPRFLAIINAGLLITLFEAALAARSPAGVPLLLTSSAILFSNGCWHLWASWMSHSYAPGTISGALLYLPLALLEYAGWMQAGRVSWSTATLSFVIGSSYPVWSALYHKQPKATVGTIRDELRDRAS